MSEKLAPTVEKSSSRLRTALGKAARILRHPAERGSAETSSSTLKVREISRSSYAQEIRELWDTGYTEYRYGGGPWIEDENDNTDTRVLRQWGFPASDGKRTPAIVEMKLRDVSEMRTRHAAPHYFEFPTVAAYEQWLSDNQVKITSEGSTEELLVEEEPEVRE